MGYDLIWTHCSKTKTVMWPIQLIYWEFLKGVKDRCTPRLLKCLIQQLVQRSVWWDERSRNPLDQINNLWRKLKAANLSYKTKTKNGKSGSDQDRLLDNWRYIFSLQLEKKNLLLLYFQQAEPLYTCQESYILIKCWRARLRLKKPSLTLVVTPVIFLLWQAKTSIQENVNKQVSMKLNIVLNPVINRHAPNLPKMALINW